MIRRNICRSRLSNQLQSETRTKSILGIMPNEKTKRKLLPITPHGVGRGLSNWGLPSLVTISDSSLSCCQGGGRFNYCPKKPVAWIGRALVTISTQGANLGMPLKSSMDSSSAAGSNPYCSFCSIAKRAINESKLEDGTTELTGQEGPVGGLDTLQVSIDNWREIDFSNGFETRDIDQLLVLWRK